MQEYCQKSNSQPIKEVLDVLDHKETRCILSNETQRGESALDERELLSLSVVLSENLPNFMELEISFQLLNANMMNILAAGIKNNTNLIRLSLHNDYIDDQAFSNLVQGLYENQSLEELDLSHNR